MSARIVLGLVLAWCLLAFGCNKRSQDNSIASDSPIPADKPSNEFSNEFFRCSDGTVYVLTANVKTKTAKLTWLVGGKAVIVDLDDLGNKIEWVSADSLGGLYLPGKNHLWYINSGIPRVVNTVPAASVNPEEHRVTAQRLLWQQFDILFEKIDRIREVDR
jgi:hypothetical protein